MNLTQFPWTLKSDDDRVENILFSTRYENSPCHPHSTRPALQKPLIPYLWSRSIIELIFLIHTRHRLERWHFSLLYPKFPVFCEHLECWNSSWDISRCSNRCAANEHDSVNLRISVRSSSNRCLESLFFNARDDMVHCASAEASPASSTRPDKVWRTNQDIVQQKKLCNKKIYR